MNRLLLTALLCLWACLGYAQGRVEAIRAALVGADTTAVLVVAHRGDWRNQPENSLSGIESAIRMGVDVVEVDLQRTADGHLILMHDATIDRTTTGRGAVAELSLDSIRRVRLRNGCAIRTKHPVPTLEETLELCRGRVMINLDKADRYFAEVMALVERMGMADHIIMKGSKSVEEVQALYGAHLGKVLYMPIVNLDKADAKTSITQALDQLKPVAIELLFRSDSNPLPLEVKALMQGKSLIWYNTLWDTMAGGHDDDMALEDIDGAYGYLIDRLGARIIQTDRPAYLLQYLRGRNLHL